MSISPSVGSTAELAALGDYERDKRRGSILFLSQLASLVIAVITIETVGSKAITAIAETVSTINAMINTEEEVDP